MSGAHEFSIFECRLSIGEAGAATLEYSNLFGLCPPAARRRIGPRPHDLFDSLLATSESAIENRKSKSYVVHETHYPSKHACMANCYAISLLNVKKNRGKEK